MSSTDQGMILSNEFPDEGDCRAVLYSIKEKKKKGKNNQKQKNDGKEEDRKYLKVTKIGLKKTFYMPEEYFPPCKEVLGRTLFSRTLGSFLSYDDRRAMIWRTRLNGSKSQAFLKLSIDSMNQDPDNIFHIYSHNISNFNRKIHKNQLLPTETDPKKAPEDANNVKLSQKSLRISRFCDYLVYQAKNDSVLVYSLKLKKIVKKIHHKVINLNNKKKYIKGGKKAGWKAALGKKMTSIWANYYNTARCQNSQNGLSDDHPLRDLAFVVLFKTGRVEFYSRALNLIGWLAFESKFVFEQFMLVRVSKDLRSLVVYTESRSMAHRLICVDFSKKFEISKIGKQLIFGEGENPLCETRLYKASSMSSLTDLELIKIENGPIVDEEGGFKFEYLVLCLEHGTRPFIYLCKICEYFTEADSSETEKSPISGQSSQKVINLEEECFESFLSSSMIDKFSRVRYYSPEDRRERTQLWFVGGEGEVIRIDELGTERPETEVDEEFSD